MALLSIPLISQYSFLTQCTILGTLLLISYLHRTTRVVLATLVSGFIALKVLIPTVKLIIYLLKGLAWIGFYVFFIQQAIVSGINALTWFMEDALPWLVNELDRARMEGDTAQTRRNFGAPMEEVD